VRFDTTGEHLREDNLRLGHRCLGEERLGGAVRCIPVNALLS